MFLLLSLELPEARVLFEKRLVSLGKLLEVPLECVASGTLVDDTLHVTDHGSQLLDFPFEVKKIRRAIYRIMLHLILGLPHFVLLLNQHSQRFP